MAAYGQPVRDLSEVLALRALMVRGLGNRANADAAQEGIRDGNEAHR